MTPSIELVQAVLTEQYSDRIMERVEVEDNILSTYYDCGKVDSQGRPACLGVEMSIYEFCHLVKKWAITMKYSLKSGIDLDLSKYSCYVDSRYSNGTRWQQAPQVDEVTSVIKAGEYILRKTDDCI